MLSKKLPFLPVVKIILAIVGISAVVLVALAQIRSQQLPSGQISKRENQTANCSSFKLVRDTIEFDQIETITPPGSIIAGSLKAHSYINFKPRQVDIIAPTGMTLVAGAKYTQPEAGDKVQYLLDFEADCGYQIRYDHISHPNAEITAQLSGPPADTTQTQSLQSIDYPAGAKIGSTDGNGVQRQFDFGVYKNGATNVFAQDERYKPYIESDVHTSAVCPFDQYTDSKNKQYYKLFSVTHEHPQPDILCNQY